MPTESASISVDEPISQVWTKLIRYLGLTSGVLNLPFEMTTSTPSTDHLNRGMKLETKGTGGTLRAAILANWNPENHSLKIKVLRTQHHNSKFHRNYEFSLNSESPKSSKLNLKLETNTGLFGSILGLFDNSSLSKTMLEHIRRNW